MTARWRLGLFAGAVLILTAAAGVIAAHMPAFGVPASHYGPAVNAIIPAARHATNMVAAVNFDVRGLDTLGEECILVCAATGAVVLLRGARGESISADAGRVPGRAVLRRTDATVILCRIAVSLTLVYGIYMALHGTITPGGGFQGGVVIASGLMLVYLGDGYALWRRMVPSVAMALLEGGGAFLFVAAAAIPLALGGDALANMLPLGQPKDLFSGGLIMLANDCVALSVTGSFGLLLLEFMEETRSPAEDPVPDEEDP